MELRSSETENARSRLEILQDVVFSQRCALNTTNKPMRLKNVENFIRQDPSFSIKPCENSDNTIIELKYIDLETSKIIFILNNVSSTVEDNLYE